MSRAQLAFAILCFFIFLPACGNKGSSGSSSTGSGTTPNVSSLGGIGSAPPTSSTSLPTDGAGGSSSSSTSTSAGTSAAAKLQSTLSSTTAGDAQQQTALSAAQKALADLATSGDSLNAALKSASQTKAKAALAQYNAAIAAAYEAGRQLEAAGFSNVGQQLQNLQLTVPIYQVHHTNYDRFAYVNDINTAIVASTNGSGYSFDGIAFHLYSAPPTQICDSAPVYQCQWTGVGWFLDNRQDCTNPAAVVNVGIVGYACKARSTYTQNELHRLYKPDTATTFSTASQDWANFAKLVGFQYDQVIGYAPD